MVMILATNGPADGWCHGAANEPGLFKMNEQPLVIGGVVGG